MPRFLLLALLLLASAARADDFVAGTEDLPLMPGLVAIAEGTLVFDKPEGRIVEARARGALSREKVEAFYAASLPQLGWARSGADRWQRGAELLRIDFRGRDGNLTVGFTLSPQQEPK
ncbi:MAG TPA: hypothetical protein VN832_06070 [Stellaceae bacterium]|nr:hypothetical protein [Stellaceae bacterium]